MQTVTPAVNLYNCDCIDYMKKIEDDAFDLAIVDPPYGLSKGSSNGGGKLKNRTFNTGNIADRWDSKPNGNYFDELFRVSKNQIIWGGNYFNLPPTRGIICWDKVQPWENFSQIEYAWTSFSNPAKLFRFNNKTGGKIHPTQKPIDLYRWLLQTYAEEDDRILDTHLGSGSIAIACDMEGFELTGCEIDEEYYDAMIGRFNKHKKQDRIQFA